MIYHEKSEFRCRKFLMIWKMIYADHYENCLCQIFIRTVLTEGI